MRNRLGRKKQLRIIYGSEDFGKAKKLSSRIIDLTAGIDESCRFWAGEKVFKVVIKNLLINLSRDEKQLWIWYQ